MNSLRVVRQQYNICIPWRFFLVTVFLILLFELFSHVAMAVPACVFLKEIKKATRSVRFLYPF